MQDCWNHLAREIRGCVTVRWCDEHQTWVVAAWAKVDGDSPFVEVHPMWAEPRAILDDEFASGTLLQLLTAVRATVRTLARDERAGQSRLF